MLSVKSLSILILAFYVTASLVNCQRTRRYIVRKRDTLYSIATSRNFPLQDVLALNLGVNPERLRLELIQLPLRGTFRPGGVK